MTTAQLGSSMTIRGVTVSFDRIDVYGSGPAELTVAFANSSGRSLQLVSNRVVVRQAGRRIAGMGDGGAAFAIGLTNDASASNFTIALPGFRPGMPYTLTATVTALGRGPAWKPLPFAFRFGAV